ncbi:MAG: hypothetical protein ABJG47_07080 [Ekhidna sp.]
MQKSLRIPALILALLIVVWITSCGKDDGGKIINDFIFNGTDYTIDGGVIYDYGAVNYVDIGDATHYNYDFIIYDGEADFQAEVFNGSFVAYAELLSFGADAFKSGVFTFIREPSLSNVDGQNYFQSVTISVDGNGNQSIFQTTEDMQNDLIYVVVGGTITVIDNGGNNFTLNYNAEVQQVDRENEELIPDTNQSIAFGVTLDFPIEDQQVSGGRVRNSKLFSRHK